MLKTILYKNYMTVSISCYLAYRIYPCTIRTPILDCTFKKKKKRRQKQWKWLRKNSVKTSLFGNTLKTALDHLFRNVTRCTGYKTISSSDGLFWRSAFVKSWIPSAVHCIQLLDYSRNTMVRELKSIYEE